MTQQTSGHLAMHCGASDMWKMRSGLIFSLVHPTHPPLTALGRIRSRPMKRNGAALWGGGADCQTSRPSDRAFPCLPRLSLSVCLQRLLACPWFPPRGVSDRNAILLLRRTSESVCGDRVLRAPSHSPPPASPEHIDSRRQARCNHSIRYAGQPLPRTLPAPQRRSHWDHQQQQQERQIIIYKSSLTSKTSLCICIRCCCFVSFCSK